MLWWTWSSILSAHEDWVVDGATVHRKTIWWENPVYNRPFSTRKFPIDIFRKLVLNHTKWCIDLFLFFLLYDLGTYLRTYFRALVQYCKFTLATRESTNIVRIHKNNLKGAKRVQIKKDIPLFASKNMNLNNSWCAMHQS